MNTIDTHALDQAAALTSKGRVAVMVICVNSDDAKDHRQAFEDRFGLSTQQNDFMVWHMGKCIRFISGQMAVCHGFDFGGMIVVCNHVTDDNTPLTTASDWRLLQKDRVIRFKEGRLHDNLTSRL